MDTSFLHVYNSQRPMYIITINRTEYILEIEYSTIADQCLTLLFANKSIGTSSGALSCYYVMLI